jgi:uncharacterized protein YqeY
MKDQIKEDLKEAMREHNETAKNTLKGALSAFTNELVAMGKTPRDELSKEESLKVIKRMEKQRKDSIEKFNLGGRSDLAESEIAELKVLEKYLPKMMSNESILEIAKSKKSELGIDDISKMGILVGAVMKETAGQADGSEVKKAVESLFD